ncbi:DUF1275 family protein [Bordetella pseudohinzii]|uniref:Predicted membrane protein n=1 Tax=Bordetella pseudohinzii TaxID=1331258 RepID=A0A0M7E5L4_9BORD|nr:DUF1275 family protein [Bordetella pseudohinzii]ANY14602.1 hypothetical protein BBN53_01075 [Bordetella pseudohinzii]KXA75790.1 hypothetical protein AW877_18850 [Bordetella pseudohinzii]KXA81149.1 hypothetical protein AW878_06055 [Bordetella pseudohinzii]CUI61882.1 Predicted membrane protein [Bordetella pseudohinzii]
MPTPDPRPGPSAHFLIALAGATDAMMMLRGAPVFAVYVTGDTARIGVALGHGQLSLALLPIMAVILAFFAATTLAAGIGQAAPRSRGAVLLGLCAALLAGAAAVPGDAHRGFAQVLWVAAAMGVLNQVRGDEAGVTFITGTLVRTGRALASGDIWAAAQGLGRWCSFLAGVAACAWFDSRYTACTLPLIAAVAGLGAARLAWRSGPGLAARLPRQ